MNKVVFCCQCSWTLQQHKHGKAGTLRGGTVNESEAWMEHFSSYITSSKCVHHFSMLDK